MSPRIPPPAHTHTPAAVTARHARIPHPLPPSTPTHTHTHRASPPLYNTLVAVLIASDGKSSRAHACPFTRSHTSGSAIAIYHDGSHAISHAHQCSRMSAHARSMHALSQEVPGGAPGGTSHGRSCISTHSRNMIAHPWWLTDAA